MGRNGSRCSSLPANESPLSRGRELKYTKVFEEQCPYYLSIGMTYEQYWDQDCTAVIFYRKAHELRLEEENFKLWLQGRYVYDAICCVAPILRAMSKARKPLEYHERPFTLQTAYSEMRKKQAEEESDRKARAQMETFAERFNRKFRERSGNDGK